LRAAFSNHAGISVSPPPWRPEPVRTSSCAAVGARNTAPSSRGALLLDDDDVEEDDDDAWLLEPDPADAALNGAT
jgi:hypothetical protein